MNGGVAAHPRLQFLARVIRRECRLLQASVERVFAEPFGEARARALGSNIEDAERVEAFAARFARLQDSLGDKFLPALLRALGESPGPALDNLDRAEKLGWLESADRWLAARGLRKQMVHEYIEDPAILASALQAARAQVPMLLAASEAMLHEAVRRGWVAE